MLLMLALAAALVQDPSPASKTSTTTAPAMKTAMKTIDKGDQSNIDDGKEVAVKTEPAWKQLWQEHSPDRLRPSVDFTKEMVVGVFLGSRPTAGYGLEIVSTSATGGALVVRYKQNAPGRGTMTAQVITSPYHLVTVPLFPGDVKFERVE